MAMGGKKMTTKERIIFISLIVLIVLGIAGYVAYDFWSVNQKTQAILMAPGVITTANKDDPVKAAEGSETVVATKDDLSTYKVAADAPRILTIDKIHLQARIRSMGLNSDKTIQAPKNVNDAGWYTGSAKPGESGGTFIDGHASGATHFGLFGYLANLKNGDTVSLEKGDGTTLTYRVVHVETIPLNAIDMSKILAPYPGVDKGLNLMTCTGKWLNGNETLDHRVVVYTEQV
ncbi:MAG: sortase domain-bontaining protein [Candidatus Saccharimonadaceae bacterium]